MCAGDDNGNDRGWSRHKNTSIIHNTTYIIMHIVRYIYIYIYVLYGRTMSVFNWNVPMKIMIAVWVLYNILTVGSSADNRVFFFFFDYSNLSRAFRGTTRVSRWFFFEVIHGVSDSVSRSRRRVCVCLPCREREREINLRIGMNGIMYIIIINVYHTTLTRKFTSVNMCKTVKYHCHNFWFSYYIYHRWAPSDFEWVILIYYCKASRQ
jgi:hypothetical protein